MVVLINTFYDYDFDIDNFIGNIGNNIGNIFLSDILFKIYNPEKYSFTVYLKYTVQLGITVNKQYSKDAASYKLNIYSTVYGSGSLSYTLLN